MNNKSPSETFAGHLSSYHPFYDLLPLFEDFLSICICVLSPSAIAGLPWDRPRFEQCLDRYANPACPLHIEKAIALLLREVAPYRYSKARDGDSYGPEYKDVLGGFYEEHILGYDPDNIFSSWDLDSFYERRNMFRYIELVPDSIGRKRVQVLDELCGSGRRLLAHRCKPGAEGYYGIDTSLVCVKMAILNLFLHGVRKAEVICITPGVEQNSFYTGYGFSETTCGIVEVNQQDSTAWQLMESSRGCACLNHTGN